MKTKRKPMPKDTAIELVREHYFRLEKRRMPSDPLLEAIRVVFKAATRPTGDYVSGQLNREFE